MATSIAAEKPVAKNRSCPTGDPSFQAKLSACAANNSNYNADPCSQRVQLKVSWQACMSERESFVLRCFNFPLGGHNDTPQIGGADYWALGFTERCRWQGPAQAKLTVSGPRSFKKFMGLVRESEPDREKF